MSIKTPHSFSALRAKRQVLLLAVALILAPLHAQLKTYLSLEAGPHWSLVSLEDPGHYFEKARALGTIAGLTVEQEIIPNLSVSTGIYYQPYKSGINMADRRKFQAQSASYTAIMIPLRVQYRIQPTEYPFTFSPRLGYFYSINSLPDEPFSGSSVISAPEGPAFSYDYNQSSDEPGKHLLELGMSLGFRFSGGWQTSLNISYLTGVMNKSSASSTLDYTDQQGSAYTAVYSSMGRGFYTTLALNMPLSNIWQMRDYRIRSRIENSTWEGKSVERKGELYVGGEIGALWRLFYASNPAIGARPMEGRGLFSYANLHTGIYAGYMMGNEIGIDMGVIYQQSNSFYSLMFDHEVDYTGKSSAPMYLEIPFRFRYFYDLHEQKLFAVVYAGASLLTQFSSGTYAAPAGEFSYTEPSSQDVRPATVTSQAERLSYVRPLLRLGTGVEYLLPISLPMYFTAYVNYMQGFMAAERLEVSAELAGGPTGGTLEYHGSAWSFEVGIKIPMSFDDRQNCIRLTR